MSGQAYDDEVSLADLLQAQLDWLQLTACLGLPAPAILAPVTSVGAHAQPLASPGPQPESAESLESIRARLGDCQRCKLHGTRKKIVFGQGQVDADLVFVGEGPGAEEDRQGLAFVGRAGELLTKMIAAMGYARDEVYICNIVKCRPPGNRDPEADEVEACEPFLWDQLASLRPRVIVALGRVATQTLLRTDRPISRLRGQWTRYQGIDLMPTFHPAYLLRNAAAKRPAWNDLQEVMKRLGKPLPSR